MVKAGLLGFAGRRKSQSNVLEEATAVDPAPPAEPPSGGGGGFRLMSTTEAERRKNEEKRRAQEKAASKFRPFSSFSAGNKSRNRSFDEDSPVSSKRDSKSSSGTQSSRPYNNGQFSSTSTLPSSADTDPSDNLFALPRPHMAQHGSSPAGISASPYKKQLPPVPPSEYGGYGEPPSPGGGVGRVRAMTSSSYASTAKPPTLDADMNFGSTSFDDLFSGLDRRPSPPEHAVESPGRSLLAGKRTFHAEPIKIDRQLEVEAPLQSWDSRGSADNLMSSPRSPENDSPPPPVPPHKYGQYAPVASHSPDVELSGPPGHHDSDAPMARQSAMSHKSQRESSPEHEDTSKSSSTAPSLQTPFSSRSGSDITTPKAALRTVTSPISEGGDDNMFAPPKQRQSPVSQPVAPPPAEQPRPQPPANDSGRRVLTQAEFRAQQQRAMAQSHQDSSDEEDYDEDEEEAQERAAQEAIARRKKQQMDLARDHMRRTTTAPGTLNRPESRNESFTMGFPSETSLQADEWEDEDVPLGILAQHGFPNKNQGKTPVQPANAIPSYLPDRPASAGPGDSRASAFRPVFARHLPDDPHASFIGGGLVRPTVRESMGFNNRGPASIAGDTVSNMHMNMPTMGYPEPQLGAPSLVEQIHMRDMTKQKYMGGASNKKPTEGPFTGMLGAQMNSPVQSGTGTRMSMMPGMQGTGMGMNMNMMGGPMAMPMMPGQMSYPMQQNEMMQMQQFQQMQQMLAAQQMQIQQMQMQQAQDPRMSMAFPSNMSDPRMSMAFPNQQMLHPQQDPRMSMTSSSFLNIPGIQRPMSIMPVGSQQTPQPHRPHSTPLGGSMAAPPLLNGYTPSIAPSERSNIGLSARYRPVATHTDTKSSSSMTLQASGGASQNPAMVKGILKNKSPVVQDDDDDGWGKMAARKNKFNVNGGTQGSADDSLHDLVRGMDGL
ncbi:hypothetical protein BU23DRAFT_471080 [Bimuria novae-zelandiae CBS 107.79]|uniref:Uncharacterized protein n=1 Tax=Bimuria novae-zelandiae CBS 107.79 TaxID=1447943 RepID=A0A6A5V2V5_9PLEO|nr:hypothetical protein BU23DRAFT_471080 [Bimuria novae-zelandiae CBS 107.79]